MHARTASPEGTIYIIDDDPAMREALSFSLGNAGYATHAFDSAQALVQGGLDAAPAAILLDVRLQDASGVQVHALWLEQGLRTPVIFMSGQSQPHEIVESFRQGALHFLIKPFTTADLLATVHEAIHRDGQRLARQARSAHLGQALAHLTPREREVCRLMLKGYPNRAIAAAHGTVAGTVKLQRASVFDKLGVASMVELAQLFAGQDADELLQAVPARPPAGGPE